MATTTSKPKRHDPADEAAAAAAHAAYEHAIGRYDAAMRALSQGDLIGAKPLFEEVIRAAENEPELAQRARTYVLICQRRLAPPVPAPTDLEQRYTRAVYLSNAGAWDEALALLDQALAEKPDAVGCLYARASVWALKGSAQRAVQDLRQAIALDPKVRFQAINDPDFEKIREEPTFIDVIEPTPAGT